MAIVRPVATRNVIATAHGNLADGGTGDNGTLEIRTGSNPEAGTVLSTHDLSDPAFGSPSNGVVTAGAIAQATASATGTAGCFAVRNKSGDMVWGGDSITTTGGGGDLEMPSTSITATETVSINVLTFTSP